jgi:hypothetical protein
MGGAPPVPALRGSSQAPRPCVAVRVEAAALDSGSLRACLDKLVVSILLYDRVPSRLEATLSLRATPPPRPLAQRRLTFLAFLFEIGSHCAPWSGLELAVILP